ncbi:MAG: beta-lactamase family protein [Rhodospirillaceae bacterium]|nr:beta-lactamase family protein [Rhodospirillaceae bacterium]
MPGLKLRALALAVIASSFSFAASADLAQDMAEALAAQRLTGVVWSTLDNGIVVTGSAGISDARSGAAMQPGARVQIGSVTKPLLAAGVLRLVTQGRLALEAPLASVLPDVVIGNPWADTDAVRVRHLLEHTSGLEDARLWQVFSLKPEPDTPLRGGIPSRLNVRTRPGAVFSYSNTGYHLLGMVIEAVTGTRYERYLDTDLLSPLGMTDSTFGYVDQAGDARLAMGHFENNVAHAAVATYVRPSTQFTTTARDMALFAQFLMGDGTVNGEAFIDAALLRGMGVPTGTEAATAGLHVGNGLGLVTRDRYGVVGKCHSGNTVGYRALLCVYPEAQRAFFMSHNADSETADYGVFEKMLVAALNLAAPTPQTATDAPFDAAPWSGLYVPWPGRFAVTALLDRAFGFASLRATDTGVRLSPFQGAAADLQSLGAGLFRAPGRVNASHVLYISPEGPRLSTGTQTLVQTSLMNLLPLWLSLGLGTAGVLFILLSGLWRLRTPRAALQHAMFVPFVGVAVLLLPAPLFLTQSFLALGDLTLASGVLAGVTLALPITLAWGLWRLAQRSGQQGTLVQALAAGATAQLVLLLALWGLWPVMLWA